MRAFCKKKREKSLTLEEKFFALLQTEKKSDFLVIQLRNQIFLIFSEHSIPIHTTVYKKERITTHLLD